AFAPVDLDVRDGWVVADGVELRFADEADVGDLYNFCPAPAGAVAAPGLALDGAEAVASFDGLEVRLRGWRRPDDPVLLGVVVDNERPDHRLRLHVRLPHGVDEVVAAAPFELVRR